MIKAIILIYLSFFLDLYLSSDENEDTENTCSQYEPLPSIFDISKNYDRVTDEVGSTDLKNKCCSSIAIENSTSQEISDENETLQKMLKSNPKINNENIFLSTNEKSITDKSEDFKYQNSPDQEMNYNNADEDQEIKNFRQNNDDISEITNEDSFSGEKFYKNQFEESTIILPSQQENFYAYKCQNISSQCLPAVQEKNYIPNIINSGNDKFKKDNSKSKIEVVSTKTAKNSKLYEKSSEPKTDEMLGLFSTVQEKPSTLKSQDSIISEKVDIQKCNNDFDEEKPSTSKYHDKDAIELNRSNKRNNNKLSIMCSISRKKINIEKIFQSLDKKRNANELEKSNTDKSQGTKNMCFNKPSKKKNGIKNKKVTFDVCKPKPDFKNLMNIETIEKASKEPKVSILNKKNCKEQITNQISIDDFKTTYTCYNLRSSKYDKIPKNIKEKSILLSNQALSLNHKESLSLNDKQNVNINSCKGPSKRGRRNTCVKNESKKHKKLKTSQYNKNNKLDNVDDSFQSDEINNMYEVQLMEGGLKIKIKKLKKKNNEADLIQKFIALNPSVEIKNCHVPLVCYYLTDDYKKKNGQKSNARIVEEFDKDMSSDQSNEKRDDNPELEPNNSELNEAYTTKKMPKRFERKNTKFARKHMKQTNSTCNNKEFKGFVRKKVLPCRNLGENGTDVKKLKKDLRLKGFSETEIKTCLRINNVKKKMMKFTCEDN